MSNSSHQCNSQCSNGRNRSSHNVEKWLHGKLGFYKKDKDKWNIKIDKGKSKIKIKK